MQNFQRGERYASYQDGTSVFLSFDLDKKILKQPFILLKGNPTQYKFQPRN